MYLNTPPDPSFAECVRVSGLSSSLAAPMQGFRTQDKQVMALEDELYQEGSSADRVQRKYFNSQDIWLRLLLDKKCFFLL